MNPEELYGFLKQHGFPAEACRSLSDDARSLMRDGRCAAILARYKEDYAAGRAISYFDAADELEKAAQPAGIHPYAAQMLFYLSLAPQLRIFYRERGLPDELFDGAISDLWCKARECHRVYGVWGSFVAYWFSRFFNFSLYTLGRLEFCLIPCPTDYEEAGLRIKKGQLCIDVHIPSREPLTRESLDDAYARAAAFFADRLAEVPTVFHCESWLLADYHDEMLPPDSGILLFAHDYERVARAPDAGDLWRIFGREDVDPPEFLPEDTRLQKAYKKRLCARLPVYGGVGLFFYDHHPKGQLL